MEKKIVYETGATSHAVNDLILFADNTRELAAIRDSICKSIADANERPKLHDFMDLWRASRAQYIKEFPNKEDHRHIFHMDTFQINEFCELYVKDFEAWKADHK